MADHLKMINYLEAGMKAEGLRQKVIANNIANMNTPGFRRSERRESLGTGASSSTLPSAMAATRRSGAARSN